MGVTLSQGPQCNGMVTVGANSLRSTNPGVEKGVTFSSRWSAPDESFEGKIQRQTCGKAPGPRSRTGFRRGAQRDRSFAGEALKKFS